MKAYTKRVTALLLVLVAIFSNMVISVAAEELTEQPTDATTKTLYRYRQKMEVTSRYPLDSSWNLISKANEMNYLMEFNNLAPDELTRMESKYSDDYYYLTKTADGTIGKYSTSPNGGTVYYYEDNFLYGPMGMYDQTVYTYYEHPTTGQKLYFRDVSSTYTLCIYTRYEYRYWAWSEWSPWSEIPCEPSDTVEVETKESSVLYRYREKEYTTSKSVMGDPWVLYNTVHNYEHEGERYVYSYYTEEIASSYCVHKTENVNKYVYGSSYFYATASEYAEMCSFSAAHGGSSSVANYKPTAGYRRYTCCQYKKISDTTYYYYKWNDWSDWSFTPITENDDVEVETKATATFSISYDANGGEGAPSTTSKNFDDEITLSTITPTRENYQFIGWATSEHGEAEYAPGDVYSANADVTFYAVWKNVTKYTVTYNANGGVGTPAEQAKIHAEPLEISSSVPTREGYVFMGWSTTSTGDVEYSFGSIYENDESITLFAVWAKNEYVIDYNANGGVNAPGYQIKTHGDNLVLASATPTRTGYNFLGWSTVQNGQVEYLSGEVYTKDASARLYAVWMPCSYTVTFDANGGMYAPSAQMKIHGTPLTLTDMIPTREGYSFRCWATDAVDEMQRSLSVAGLESSSNAATGGKTLTISCPGAKFIELTFDEYTRFAFGDDYLYVYDVNSELVGKYTGWELAGETITVQGDFAFLRITSNSYAGRDWYFKITSAIAKFTTIYAPGASYTLDEDVTLYAVWDINTYTVRYSANGGKNAPESQVKNHGTRLTLSSAVPTRSCYTFQGWSTTSNGNVEFLPGEIYSGNENIILYAVWSGPNHSWDSGKITTKPTHTTYGVRTYTCEDCSATKTEQVAKTPEHSYSSWTKLDAENHQRTCICGDVETKIHSWNDGVITTYPTHTTFGEQTYSCNDCAATKTEQVAKTPEHSYGSWTKVDAENHQRTCACGDVETETHNWNAGVITTKPTHTTYGVRTYTCEDCSATKMEQVAKTPEHSYGSWTKVDAENHQRTCACGDVETETHNWDAGVITTKPTHTTYGVRTYTCEDCSATKTGQVAKTPEHSYGSWIKVDAENHQRVCICGDAQRGNHQWDSGVITTPPTGTTFGVKTYTCEDCSATKTESVSKLTYTVTFKDADGSVISSGVYNYGDAITVPANPTKAADSTYTYTFAGWDNTVVSCAGNATYTATYTPVYIDYTVVFKDWDGTILSEKTYHYGDEVVIPANPTKAADDTYTYAFAGWDEAVVDCEGHAVYIAQYTAIPILNGWVLDGGNWYYYVSDIKQTGWVQDSSVWYYMNAEGIMQTGWVSVGGTWYYMNRSGAMQTGWLQSGSAWYYLKSSGAMAIGWAQDGGMWYYFNASGVMQTGWLQSGNTWYYLKSSGGMQTGWLNLNGTWYYFQGSGAMVTGWLNLNGTWYYFQSSGAMVTGWLQISGTWYYFQGSGAMATNITISGGWIDSSGVWHG